MNAISLGFSGLMVSVVLASLPGGKPIFRTDLRPQLLDKPLPYQQEVPATDIMLPSASAGISLRTLIINKQEIFLMKAAPSRESVIGLQEAKSSEKLRKSEDRDDLPFIHHPT